MIPKVAIIAENDWANVGFMLNEAINQFTTWVSRCIIKNKHPFGYPYDLIEASETRGEALTFLRQAHYYLFVVDFRFRPFNVKLKRYTPKGIWHVGSMYRNNYAAFERISNFFEDIFLSEDLEGLCKGKHRILNAPYDLDTYQYIGKEWDGKLIIGHSPSGSADKGTEYFVNATNRLINEGYNIGVDLIQGVQWDESRLRKKDHHVFFDQICNYITPKQVEDGCRYMYGVSLLEAGSHGAICLASHDYGKRVPFFNVRTEDDIYNTIKSLCEGRKNLPKLSKNTRNYIEEHHSYGVISNKLINIIEKRVYK